MKTYSHHGSECIINFKIPMKIFPLLLFLYSLSYSFEISDFDNNKIDSIFAHCPKINYNRLSNRSPRTYVSFSSIDVSYDFTIIVNFLLKYFLNPKNQFQLFHWFDILERTNDIDSIWYYKITYGPIGYWSLLKLMKLSQNDTICEIELYQNHDKSLNEKKKQACRRLIVIENKEQIMIWKIMKISENKTRIGFLVQSVPTKYVPNWLYKLTINIIIPDCLQDINKYFKNDKKRHAEVVKD